MGNPFYIVDVFTQERFLGNPLAVILEAQSLPSAEMQRIAREMNYSETVFLMGMNPDHSWEARYFTPEKEIPFAGHPSLGSAWVIREKILKQPVDSIILDLQAGKITVDFSKFPVIWMTQNSPIFGKEVNSVEASRMIGLEPGDLLASFQPRVVSTGLPFVVIGLKGLEEMKKVNLNWRLREEILETYPCRDLLLFCPESVHHEDDFFVRVLTDSSQVPEDPATGSAAGCLTACADEYGLFKNKKVEFSIEQGTWLSRRSRLYCRVQNFSGRKKIQVGGQVVLAASGELV